MASSSTDAGVCRPRRRAAARTFASGAVGVFALALMSPVRAEADAEIPLPLCPPPEDTLFACPLRGGGALQLCSSPGDSTAKEAMRVIFRELASDGTVAWSFGGDRPASEAYRANFLTNGALTLAHLRFEANGVQYVLIAGEDQTSGLAGLARANANDGHDWQLCTENWKSRLDYRLYSEAGIPADPRAAPLP
jgi:hypothetical protein